MRAGISIYRVLTTLQWETPSVVNLIYKECILPRYIAKSDRRYIIPRNEEVMRMLLYVRNPLVSWPAHGTSGREQETQQDTTGE
jgi:hypothetical protein